MSTSTELAGNVAAEGHGLKKELRLADLVPMQILLLVGVSWAGIAAKQGSGHAVIWLAGIPLFFLPQAMVVRYCVLRWPIEGGVYQWVKFALGPMAGFLSAWNYGLYAILTISQLGIQTVTSLSYALGPSAAWMVNSTSLTLLVDAVLLLGVLGINIVGFHFGKWVSHFGAWLMVGLTLTFFVLLFWHPAATAARPHVSPQAPFAFFLPAMTLLTLNLFAKVAFNAYAGLEQIAVFAGEMRDAGRLIVRSAWIAAPAIVVIYVLMTGSMLTYVPSGEIDLAGAIPQVLAAAFGGSGAGVWLGRVMIGALAAFTVCSYALITAETSRLPLVAGWDDLLPAWFTRLHPRFGTPVRSLVVIVAVAGVFAVLASVGAGRQEAFQLLITSGQLLFGLYYCAMFLVPLVAGWRGDEVSWWLRIAAATGLAVTVAQTLLAMAPIVDVSSSWSYAAKVGGTGLVVNLVGVGLYLRGRVSRRES